MTLGFILATLAGALFHLIVGGDARRLALFLLAAWVGFGLGHVLGGFLGIDVMNVGSLRVVAATAGALVALVAAHVLTLKRMAGRPRG
jgi:uncharacterized membrane protein YeaQ/YmgE (transglycosylase-associated protein family)